MASSNPANFANLPKDKLSEIAAKGGHASHGGHAQTGDVRFAFSLPLSYTPVLTMSSVH
jgi:hypothetical protein